MALKTALVVGAGYPQAIQAGDILAVPALQSSGQISSTLATGTAPLVVASTTKVTNLNADLLDGNDSAWFQQALVSGTSIKTVNGTSLLGSGNIAVAGGQSQIVTSFSGTLTLPFTGSSRRYFNASRTFTTATLGVSSAATITVTVKKNGTSVGTISLTGATYTSTGLSFSVVASDYITIDVSGSTNPADLILTLE